MLFDNLKNRFLHFTQVAFWAGQEAENEFNMPGEHLKHRFLDLTQIAILVVQEVEMSSQCLEIT